MRRVALLAGFGLLAHSVAAQAQVNYAWTSHFDMGTTESTVLATDGRTLFGLTCGMPMGAYIMGAELETNGASITQGQAPTVMQVILDGKAYDASLTGRFGTATTLGDKTSLANLASALAQTTSPYFQVQIPDLDWARTFSTQSARQALQLRDPSKPNVFETVLDPCLDDAPSAQSALNSPPQTTQINPEAGPSFPCPQPKDPLAQLICTTPALALLDMRFVQTYEALYQQAGPSGDPTIRRADLDFDAGVRSKCGIGLSQTSNPSTIPPAPAPAGSADCVAPAYQQRISIWASQLTGAAAQEAARPIADQVALQRRLRTLGFLPAQSQLDGVFGHGTRAAIVNWQTSVNRIPTGLLGAEDAQVLLGGSAPSPVATSAPATQQSVITPPSPSPSVETAWAPYIQYAACISQHGFSLQTFVTQGVAPTDAIAAAAINLCDPHQSAQAASNKASLPNMPSSPASDSSSGSNQPAEKISEPQQLEVTAPAANKGSNSSSTIPTLPTSVDLSSAPTPKNLLFCAGYILRADVVASNLLPDPMTLTFFSMGKTLAWQGAAAQAPNSSTDNEVAPYLVFGEHQIEQDAALADTIAHPMKSDMVQKIIACQNLNETASMPVPTNDPDFVAKNFNTPRTSLDQRNYADRIGRIAYCDGYLSAAANVASPDPFDARAISNVASFISKTVANATADQDLIKSQIASGTNDENQDASTPPSARLSQKLKFCMGHMIGWQP